MSIVLHCVMMYQYFNIHVYCNTPLRSWFLLLGLVISVLIPLLPVLNYVWIRKVIYRFNLEFGLLLTFTWCCDFVSFNRPNLCLSGLDISTSGVELNVKSNWIDTNCFMLLQFKCATFEYGHTSKQGILMQATIQVIKCNNLR